MKQARLVIAALLVVVVGTWAAGAMACDKDKTMTSAAVAKSTAITAESTPATVASAKDGCSSHKSSTAAVTASSSGAYDRCAGKTSKAAAGMCTGKGAFSTASNAGADHCRGAKSAAMASANGHCGGRGMATLSGRSAHGDCDACTDMSACNDELEAAGAHIQVVSLKNGVMFVYTADSPGQVNAVQSALARRGEHLAQFVSAGDRAHLCSECKSMRGAVASGKMVREVVNIEGGSLTLVTSTDPGVVAKIHAMVDTRSNARLKS